MQMLRAHSSLSQVLEPMQRQSLRIQQRLFGGFGRTEVFFQVLLRCDHCFVQVDEGKRCLPRACLNEAPQEPLQHGPRLLKPPLAAPHGKKAITDHENYEGFLQVERDRIPVGSVAHLRFDALNKLSSTPPMQRAISQLFIALLLLQFQPQLDASLKCAGTPSQKNLFSCIHTLSRIVLKVTWRYSMFSPCTCTCKATASQPGA
mmetsp:Transcript_12282/g.29331  ORF Transcript_12282/g.29331 Transcript_12282/m.29331 type:complete len:204 (+) Transcript_12282:280-891(+)